MNIYYVIVGGMTATVSLAYAILIIFRTSVVVDGFALPLWFSYIGIFIVGCISFVSFRLASGRKTRAIFARRLYDSN